MRRWFLAVFLGLSAAAQASTLTEAGYRALERAQHLLAEGQATAAHEVLAQRFARAESDDERALIRQVQGFALAAVPDPAAAIQRLRQALEYPQLPQPAALQSRLALGQLLYVEHELPAAVRELQAYLELAGDQAVVEAQVMLAAAHVSAGAYHEARPPLAAALARQASPPLAWLELKLAIEYGLEAWAEAAETLLMLVARSPQSAAYWQQLSGVYYELGRQPRSLAVLALAHRHGVLEEGRSLRTLAQLYQALGIPYKAGELLSEALADGRLDADAGLLDRLADAWISAREYPRAVAVLEQRLDQQPSAEVRLRLAQVHAQRSDWVAVIDTLGRAPETLDGAAALLLGIAAYERSDFAVARTAFTRARGTADQRRAADQWLRYLAERAAP